MGCDVAVLHMSQAGGVLDACVGERHVAMIPLELNIYHILYISSRISDSDDSCVRPRIEQLP